MAVKSDVAGIAEVGVRVRELEWLINLASRAVKPALLVLPLNDSAKEHLTVLRVMSDDTK